jgi:hypothetical protein
MNKPEQPNDLQIIASYIARRDRIADLTKAFEAAVAPFRKA